MCLGKGQRGGIVFHLMIDVNDFLSSVIGVF